MMLNSRRRRQRADIGHQSRASTTSDLEDDEDYPKISSRTGGYESSVASHLISSASEHASWSTGEDARTVKADNTTTATSHELLKFRFPHTRGRRSRCAPVSNTTHAYPTRTSAASSEQQRGAPSTTPHHHHAVDKSLSYSGGSRTSSSFGEQQGRRRVYLSSCAKDRTKAEDRQGGAGRTFLRNLVGPRPAFRVARNNTDATVEEDIVSDDSRTSPQRQRFVLPIDTDEDIRRSVVVTPSYTTSTSRSTTSKNKQKKKRSDAELANDGYEVLTHPSNKTMTIVHSSLMTRTKCATKSQPKLRMLVDSDLVDTDEFHNSSDSSSFSQLLMTDGDLMKNPQRFGTGVIRLTVDSLKEHEHSLHHDNTTKAATTNKSQTTKGQRKHLFSFWRRANCEITVQQKQQPARNTLDDIEKSRIEQKRQAYLLQQREREFGSVTKEQRDSIFDSLADNKSRATHSTVSSAASHMTPRCHGCPTTGAMVDTVSFWSD